MGQCECNDYENLDRKCGYCQGVEISEELLRALRADLTRVMEERDEWKEATTEAWDTANLGWKLFEKDAAQYEHPTGEVFYQCPDPDGGFECSCKGDDKCKLAETACVKSFLVDPVNAYADAKRYGEMATELETALAQVARLREVVGMVEWIEHRGVHHKLYLGAEIDNPSSGYCPWCDSLNTQGHTDNCPRQSVIEGEGTKSTDQS